jgi:nucleoside-diphosphate-sugar epimerase
MMTKQALVVGGLGVTGRGIVAALAQSPDWEIVALSRRSPEEPGAARHISVDLADRADAEAKLSGLTNVTHIFFAAYQERPNPAEEVAPNLAILRNTVEIIERVAPGLEHVNLMQGTKAYGTHLGPYKTPARETDPRHMPPNFYYDQQDFLKERCKGKSWSWSALRPRTICGIAVNTPMNLVSVIAVYAAISKELGLPLRFPGTPGGYGALQQMVDAELLGRAAVWAATEPRCAGEIFNVTNGGLFRWEQMWRRFAEYFEMEQAPLQTLRLVDAMADKVPVWDAIVRKHDLKPYKFQEIASWKFGDMQLHQHWDSISETTKIRRFGFHEVVDDEEMFVRLFDRLRDMRMIP